jgi:hypothetical protein
MRLAVGVPGVGSTGSRMASAPQPRGGARAILVRALRQPLLSAVPLARSEQH